MPFSLKSSAFANGEPIPVEHTCDGEDRSPPLEWSDAPPATQSFALVCDDPDAPAGTWVHWLIYGIPAGRSGLEEGIPKRPKLPDGTRQGRNDFKKAGYGGPCPPRGPAHRYFFRIYALDADPAPGPGTSKADLLNSLEGHILDETQLMGTYRRR